jgi:hypothetical protein
MKRDHIRLVALLLWLAGSLCAQYDTGAILGTVTDRSGGLIPGVKVVLVNTGTGLRAETATDENGRYEFPNVRVGTYKVSAEKSGFSTAVAGAEVSVNTRQRVDIEMQVGQVSETVEVSAAASVLETDSSQRGQAISHATAIELPLNGRDYSSLVLLTSGTRVSPIGTGSAVTVLTREGSFNVNGLRSTFNNYLLDGTDNNAYGTSNQGFSNQVMQPPPDAIAAFQVVTNNTSAEFGRSGGATVNVAYASGTNGFHLSLWEFLRNTNLNAVGFFRPRFGTQFPFHRNQFGAVFSGPIVKNRVFFLVDYEGFRQIRNIPTYQTIATTSQRQGILPVTVTNPLTGRTYAAGTQIPASDIQPFARQVLADLPAPSFATDPLRAPANNYQISQMFRNYTDKYDAKLDYQISQKLNGFTRVGQRKANLYDQPPLPLPSGGSGNGYTRVLNQQLVTGLTWVPSATQVLDVRFGVSRSQGGKSPVAVGLPDASSMYGIPGLPTDARITGGLPTELISGYSDLGRQATNPQWQYPTVYNPKANYSRLMGVHSLKFGYEYQRVNTQVQDVNPLYGRDSYAGRFSGDNFADFLFGLRSQYALSTFLITNINQSFQFAYVQDDWKILPNLTLNLGVRYEYGSPQWESNNVLTNFDPATVKMIKAPGGSTYDRALVHPDLNDWGPRVGLAFSATPSTVIRGGFGVNYVHFNRAGSANLLPINGPQVIFATVSQIPSQSNFLTTQQGYPTGLTSPANFDPLIANVTYLPSNTRDTYVMSWFFSVQQKIGQRTTADVAYVGNRTNKLLLFENYNQARPNLPGQTLSLTQRQNTRPFPTFGDITFANNGGFADYNSLQIRLEHRVGTGLFFLNSFTWSKALDNGSGSLENPNGNYVGPQDYYNLAADKGLSAYNQPFTNITSVVYTLPFGKGQRYGSGASNLTNALIGGWQVSAVNNWFSGSPITLAYGPIPPAAFQVSGIQQDFRGANNYRVSVAPGTLVNTGEDHVTRFFNQDLIRVPVDPSQPFGTASRNIARADAVWQLDFAVLKNFPISWEKSLLQFRAEFFNIPNRVNFLAPSSVCGAWNATTGVCTQGTFGAITSTLDPRLIQFGLKFMF